MSELDDDFDTCEPCEDCGRTVGEAGSPYCDLCLEQREQSDEN